MSVKRLRPDAALQFRLGSSWQRVVHTVSISCSGRTKLGAAHKKKGGGVINSLQTQFQKSLCNRGVIQDSGGFPNSKIDNNLFFVNSLDKVFNVKK